MEKFHLISRVVANEKILDDVAMMTFESPDIAHRAKPGQFLMVQVSRVGAPLFKRPFGVARVEGDLVSFIYRKVGIGTTLLAETKIGEKIVAMGPLGHGFTLTDEKALIVGGGIGLAPLYFLAQRLPDVDILMGGRCRKELFWSDSFSKIPGVGELFLTSDDGSVGTHGTVMTMLPEIVQKKRYRRVYVCGPAPMMQAVKDFLSEKALDVEISLERHMACGIGACLSCACESAKGRVKVCKDGPVFNAREIQQC